MRQSVLLREKAVFEGTGIECLVDLTISSFPHGFYFAIFCKGLQHCVKFVIVIEKAGHSFWYLEVARGTKPALFTVN